MVFMGDLVSKKSSVDCYASLYSSHVVHKTYFAMFRHPGFAICLSVCLSVCVSLKAWQQTKCDNNLKVNILDIFSYGFVFSVVMV